MIPMSSSSSHNAGRRRPASSNRAQRRPLARTNSSLFGTIKNIVTAPLNWFATTEDFDDSPDLKGKRRRNPVPAGNGPTLRDPNDAAEPRSKRPRVTSPDRQMQYRAEAPLAETYAPSNPGYLDPPVSVFKNPPPLARSTSVNLSGPAINPFIASLTRNLSRTMSIDPPHTTARPLSRDASMHFPSDGDVSMESMFPRKTSSSMPREMSMPIPASHSSLRRPTSITPQPSQLPRETSEPPPMSSLSKKPMFVRGPLEAPSQRISVQTTLGSLADSRRSTRSPARQHSGLLFGSGPSASTEQQGISAERALHELDSFKTPLLQTRSRLGAQASTHTDDPSDLFRRKRTRPLVLMGDDRGSSYGFLDIEPKEKEKKSKVNDTKPYAGEGGMRKLLARRQKEVEAEQDEGDMKQPPSVDISKTVPDVNEPLPPIIDDWQQRGAAQTGSSLRVARAKTSRNHISRPAARPAKKFSAVFEDDDGMDEEDEERQKERLELEEAASKLPAFKMPANFSFAKPEATPAPVQAEEDVKEPPIAALPFSFNIPTPAVVAAPAAVATPLEKPASSSFSFAQPDPKPAVVEASSSDDAPSSVPNFFSSSKLLSQAPSVVPSVPSFSSTDEPKPVSPFSFLAPSKNVETSDEKKTSEPTPAFSLSSGVLPSVESPASAFGTPQASAPSLLAPAFPVAEKVDTPTIPSFFNKPASTPFSFATTQPVPVSQPEPSPLVPASIPVPVVERIVETTVPAMVQPTAEPTPVAAPLTVEPTVQAAVDPPSNPFGAPLAPPSKSPFNFLSTNPPSGAATPAPASTEAPKPFTGFSFGPTPTARPTAQDAPKTAVPFNFGSSSSTAPTGGFSFGASEAKPASGMFSFSKPDTAAPTAGGSSTFSFGSPAAVAPPARPLTPPRNDIQEFNMDESPTREVEPKAAGGFSFSGSFSQPAAPPTTNSFSFTSSSSNPFPSSTSFGSAPNSGSPFSFARNNSTAADPPRPSTAGSFSFGSPAPSSGFTFGNNSTTSINTSTSSTAPASNPFMTGGSAPSSPATFGQQPFSFGGGSSAPPPALATSFSFGSQPSSPAPTSATLPQPSTPGGPFSFGSAAASPAGGGGLFTMGAAPTSSGPPGGRLLKKLPRRKN
ncbi:unnamed protein product [Mycena citricolor]|uniref:Uncharacterized protein n=1 Tax=Mycena citricolor TaxID=2018698 RepID=A0AAD2Q171_9AGAR|nr:unnamed protein product [Mycena citricolor]